LSNRARCQTVYFLVKILGRECNSQGATLKNSALLSQYSTKLTKDGLWNSKKALKFFF
jgi:hypothetical protein